MEIFHDCHRRHYSAFSHLEFLLLPQQSFQGPVSDHRGESIHHPTSSRIDEKLHRTEGVQASPVLGDGPGSRLLAIRPSGVHSDDGKQPEPAAESHFRSDGSIESRLYLGKCSERWVFRCLQYCRSWAATPLPKQRCILGSFLVHTSPGGWDCHGHGTVA